MERNAELIAVGSELLLGQITNTNAQFLSQKLAEIGVNVYYHTVVGDNPKRLKSALEVAMKRSNIIILTGGLGPTKDDLTKETIASICNRTLVLDKVAMESIEQYFRKTKRKMTENNRKQALVISDSHVLKNEVGMAPGMAFIHNEKLLMLLPGPPKEMNPMFVDYGIPYLKNMLGINEKIVSRVLRFFGIGEAQLEAEIEDIIEKQSNPTIAPLAKDGEVTIRITAKYQDNKEAELLIDQVEQKILKRVGKYFYGYNESTLPIQLLHVLQKNHLTISSAESLTGGLFLEELTAISGASSSVKGGIVCYTNEVKQNVLNVTEKTLKQHGAVSAQCAKEMAENIRTITKSDIGISFTGVAGPSPLENKPVGTVFIGISYKKETIVKECHFAGTREAIRNRAVKFGYHQVIKMIDS